MGCSTYSSDVHAARAAARAATGRPAMKHDHDVRTGKAAAAVHPLLDIKGKDRESRDSDAHPRSKSIVVMFDHTGSMGDIPALLQAELPKLMSLLVGKNYCEHPQVLFGCVGDAYDGSVAPLQVGQFESGNEMDDAFAAMLLERLGGGTNQESYELAMYYFAHHVKMDCLERRGEKGYMFVIGDEAPYPAVDPDKVRDIIGDDLSLEMPLPTATIAAQLRDKFDVFFLIPRGSSNFGDSKIRARWTDLLGEERVIDFDPRSACETIAATVGLMEGAIDAAGLRRDLADVGAAPATVASVTSGLAALAASTTAIAKVGTGDLPARRGPGATVRL